MSINRFWHCMCRFILSPYMLVVMALVIASVQFEKEGMEGARLDVSTSVKRFAYITSDIPHSVTIQPKGAKPAKKESFRAMPIPTVPPPGKVVPIPKSHPDIDKNGRGVPAKIDSMTGHTARVTQKSTGLKTSGFSYKSKSAKKPRN